MKVSVLVLLDVVGSGCGGTVLWDVSTVTFSVLVLLDVDGSGCGALSCRMRAL